MGERYEAYKICQQRGHQPADMVLTSNPPQNVCKHCGCTYRSEVVIHEGRVPTEDE